MKINLYTATKGAYTLTAEENEKINIKHASFHKEIISVSDY
jgi:hypothetical protein